ncbi:MAG: hypothetical protein AB7P99_06080 [Vicinamibacterales bacterium]
MRVFALSFHADYRCAHSGVCCSSDWDVPVELPIYRSLEQALAAGRIAPAAPAYADDPPLITGDDLPEDAAAMLARTATGDCVFYHRGSSLCVVHRDAGESHLPATCRHFPRLAVRDRRGTFVSLTHFCPTAAASLFRDDVDTEIIEAPPAFPAMDYEGLTVGDDEWPPLLHPRMLMDLEGYDTWERHMVARCAVPGATADDVIATLTRDAQLLRDFNPAAMPLARAVAALPGERVAASPHDALAPSLAARSVVVKAIPDDLLPPPDEEGLEEAYARLVLPEWRQFDRPLTRYLAAKAFANWTAYQGRGIVAIIRGLDAALALVRVEAARMCRNTGRSLDADLLKEAIRAADFTLNHLAAGEDLAASWSEGA